MIEPIFYEPVLIKSFIPNSTPVYSFEKDSHIYYDVCSCSKYFSTSEDDEFKDFKPKRSIIKQKYLYGDKIIDTLSNHLESLTIWTITLHLHGPINH